jgi:16S rRNA (cytosine967-C5)-methyltransferase
VVWVQDLGSQLVGRLADAGSRVLDACAAPGGKTALLADLDPERRVVALEVSPRRLAVLRALLQRWDTANVRLVRADARRPPFRDGAFDSVLLDAPCSGLGTLGRNPDIKWTSAAGEIERHAERQRALLLAAAPLVRSGGRLVYSACTLEPEETTAIVEALLAERSDFHRALPPAWAAPFAEPDGVRVRPERDPGDGFFAVILERD